MSRTRRTRRAMAQMNVVPYIDVMLVLLVIFMVTAPMMQAGIEIQAPNAATQPLTTDNQQEPLIIYVDQTGKYFLSDGTAVNTAELTQYIADNLDTARTRKVLIKGDARGTYADVFSAMVAAQQAGAKNLGLLNNPVQVNPR